MNMTVSANRAADHDTSRVADRAGATSPSVRDALNRQLAVIAGNEPPTSYVSERAFVPVGEFDDAIGRIVALAPRFNVFIGAAPRIRQEGKAAAIERVWCLWSDCDEPKSVTALGSFRPAPSLVVRSGSGENLHAWWALREPIPPEWARRANRRIALALAADLNATDPARVMRPAGTLNHKHSPPTAVVCVGLKPDTFTLPEVVRGLQDTTEYLPNEQKSAPGGGAGSGTLTGLARTVREAREGNRNAALYWSARRAREQIEAGELDEHGARTELHEAALVAGLDEREIEATLRSAFDGREAA
jgi:hypothetical protein